MSYNDGQWTEARFRSFIISALRSASQRWGPKTKCIKEASAKARQIVLNCPEDYPEFFSKEGKYKTGPFLCEGCRSVQPASIPPPAGYKGKKKSIKNKLADHIHPIVPPSEGFTSFDAWIHRCFVDSTGYQALCYACHKLKSDSEAQMRKVK